METPQTTSITETSVAVRRGSVLIYRLFDVAEEIDLIQVERILKQEAGGSRLRIERGPRQALVMRNAPVRVNLGEVDLKLGHLSARCEVVATVFDYGVISVVFQIPLARGGQPMPWRELMLLSDQLNAPASADVIDTLARKKSLELSHLVADALKSPKDRDLFEDYTLYFLEDVAGVRSPTELPKVVDLAALILGETTERLSPRSAQGILENTFQYSENDLAVIDWNAAVVMEPSGMREVADVLEFALTHLLEFRYYDDLLDRRLSELYDAVEERRNLKGWKRIWGGQFAVIAQEANTRFLEFSEFIERIDNSLKVVGDFYLAVIFRAAIRRFRLPDWQQSVSRKMGVLARVSELLQGEINVQRGHALELVIISLILFEILTALFKVL